MMITRSGKTSSSQDLNTDLGVTATLFTGSPRLSVREHVDMDDRCSRTGYTRDEPCAVASVADAFASDATDGDGLMDAEIAVRGDAGTLHIA